MEFSRKDYWSGLPFLPQGIFLIQGSNAGLLLDGQVDARVGDDAQNPRGALLTPEPPLTVQQPLLLPVRQRVSHVFRASMG